MDLPKLPTAVRDSLPPEVRDYIKWLEARAGTPPVFDAPPAGPSPKPPGAADEPTAYDTVPYPSHAFVQTHPDRLATLATLFGLTPAPVDRCRVLELGCGNGANLIPMAFGLPDSQFVGLDLAGAAITRGRAMVQALELTNVTLHQCDLMDVPEDFGEFDYIIAHGVYSWIPAAAQDKLLAICSAQLAPNGVSYVSYNAQPGGHVRTMLRDMMLFHVQHIVDPDERTREARTLLEFLATTAPEIGLYQKVLADQVGRLARYQDASLYHDDLAPIYQPLYFHQFMAESSRHGLQYLAEANFFEMQENADAPVAEQLDCFAGDDVVAREQYLDFLKGRGFRQTLLCHTGVRLDRELLPERITGFHFASTARPVSATPDVASTSKEEFRTTRGASLSTNHPLAKAVLVCLDEAWPQELSFEALLARSRSMAGGAHGGATSLDEDRRALAALLLRFYGSTFVELHAHPPRCAREAGERPVASRLARLQVESSSMVTNLRHVSVEIEGVLARRLLELLDGTRDRAALLAELTAFAAATEGLGATDDPPVEPQDLAAFAEQLEASLARLARLALLTA
jgi:methyltransferase-like protein/trans-aconitate methyltransferase